MRRQLAVIVIFMIGFAATFVAMSCSNSHPSKETYATTKPTTPEAAQVPTWSSDDMEFFLHGSMSTEFVPERVVKAFIETYPDLFPSKDLSNFGLIPDPAFGWPVGISRGNPAQLGGMPSVGVNCASCHVGEIEPASGEQRVRVLGMTSHFDAEAFFGSVIVATFRTQEPANMKRFLTEYGQLTDGENKRVFDAAWEEQKSKIVAAMAADPAGSSGAGPGGLQEIREPVTINQSDFPATSVAMLKLFHNMRAALHVPDQPPETSPPASGPGRNDAFGLLSAILFNSPQPYAPVKYGLVWNVDHRYWVHWDGNTRSPIARNLLASLGLGAPLIGKYAQLDFKLVERQTTISQKIRAPKYPFAIDQASVARGASLYQASCLSCHSGPEGDERVHRPDEVGTDPTRANAFSRLQAERFNSFLTNLQLQGYMPARELGIRSTQQYWAASLDGVWARSPYLHNGSVRTMHELLTPANARATTFHRGSRVYDENQMGYTDAGLYLLDTTTPGNSNAGHEYGTKLTEEQKRDLIEYLKKL